MVYDGNLGGHDPVAIGGRSGRPGIMTKPWRAQAGNALDGKMFVVYLDPV